ncbi:MAG: glycosyltransferase family 39 protein [Calditrichaeota bacterium]|nr:glycosyltransferase family 39 protein [Calditrichota bacterium]
MKARVPDMVGRLTGQEPWRLLQRGSVVFLVALLVRIAYVLLCNGSYALDVGDQAAYERIAREWVSGGQFMPGSSYRPPAYPAFVAAIYWVFGPHRVAVELAQALIGAVTALLVMLLARHLFSSRAAVVAGWTVALLPVLVHFSAQLMAETLFTALLIAVLLILVRDDTRGAGQAVVWAGVLVGLGALMRPNVLLLPAALAFWWRWSCRLPVLATFKKTLLCLAVALVTILPWSIRNLNVQGSFVPVSTNGGVNLWIGNNEHATGDWLKPGDYWSPSGNTEVEVDRQYYRAALQFMVAHPGRTLGLAARKLCIFWLPYPHATDRVPSVLLVPLVLVGLATSLPRRRTWILLATIVYFTLVSCVFFANQRFHVPLLPVLAVYAGAGGERLWEWCARKRSGRGVRP